MSECPELAVLEHEARTVSTHVAACTSCRLVLELLDERKAATADRDRRAECARFELLLAAREDGSLGGAAAAFLDEHLRGCADCTALAATMPPIDRVTGSGALPAVPIGAYALGREVARGGMGRILAAEDLRIGRPVAVKELLGKSPVLAARFEREARVTARLQHPGIVPIYEIGTWPDGTPFYAMRMIEGRTLREALRDKPALDDRLALLPALIAATQAVAFAHGKQIIHRDLTPNNILVGAHGDTVVIDWGLAKDLSDPRDVDLAAGPYRDEATTEDLTHAGAVIGTAAYMPPEQAAGDAVDERADVYALGAMLYHLLANEPPYRGTTSADVLRQVQAASPPRIATVAPGAPRDLVSIVGKAMARDRSLRYATAADLAAELRRFQTGRLVEAHHYSRRERTRRWIGGHRATVFATAAAALAMVVAGSIGFAGIVRERDRAEDERSIAIAQRSVADTASAKARELAVGLIEDRGRRELLDGNRERALVYLSAAYSAGADSPGLRFMLAESMTELDDEISRFDLAHATDAVFDHRGVHVVVRGEGSGAAVFDVATGARVSELGGQPNQVKRLSFSSDDLSLVGVGDGSLRRWDVASGTQTATVKTHRSGNAATALYDGDHVATGGDDGEIKLWDARTLALLGVAQTSSGRAYELVASPDGRHLLAVGASGSATVLDGHTGRRERELVGHTGQILAITDVGVFDRSGTRVVLGDVGGTVKVWDVDHGVAVLTLAGHGVPVAAHFSPEGDRIVVADFRGDGYVADARTGVRLSTFHRSGGFLGAQWVRDGTKIFVGTLAGDRGELSVLDADTGTVLMHVEGRPIGSDEHDRVAISTGEQVRIVPLMTSRLVRELRHDKQINSSLFTLDSNQLLTRQVDGARWISNLGTGARTPLAAEDALLDSTNDGARQAVRGRGRVELRDGGGAVLASLDVDQPVAAFSPDDQWLAVGGDKGVLRLFDAATSVQRASLDGHRVALRSVAFAGRRDRLVTLDVGGEVRVWSWDGALVGSCHPEGQRVAAVQVSDDGIHMALVTARTGSGTQLDGPWQPSMYEVEQCRRVGKLGAPIEGKLPTLATVGPRLLIDHTVWDWGGELVAEIPGLPDPVELVLSPRGDRVAALWMAMLWTVVAGKPPVATDLEGLAGMARFSADGTLFFQDHTDGTVWVREIENGRLIAKLPGTSAKLVLIAHEKAVKLWPAMVDASRTGDRLVVGGPDHTARVWSIAGEKRSAAEIARIVATRSPWKLDGAVLVHRDVPKKTP